MKFFHISRKDKKQTEAKLFTYNEQEHAYTASIRGISFLSNTETTPEIIEYAKKLAEIYESRQSAIADFLLADEAFDKNSGIFPEISKDGLIASLHAPTIQLLSDKDGICTYCDHTLDDTHLITFEFSELFDDLCYLSIDG